MKALPPPAAAPAAKQTSVRRMAYSHSAKQHKKFSLGFQFKPKGGAHFSMLADDLGELGKLPAEANLLTGELGGFPEEKNLLVGELGNLEDGPNLIEGELSGNQNTPLNQCRLLNLPSCYDIYQCAYTR